MVKMLKSMVIIFGLLSLATLSTNSYYASRAIVSGNTFSTGTWEIQPPQVARVVINEVYYDVDATHGGDGNVSNSGEWIELYNGGNVAVNLRDWTIADNTITRTINSDHTLAPGEYALIAKDINIWNLYWQIPAETELIELGQVIGGGLANGGDRLTLKDNQNTIVDRISYGTDTTILNPSIYGVAEGHSIARNPAGLDTDTVTDFIDQVTPTPGS